MFLLLLQILLRAGRGECKGSVCYTVWCGAGFAAEYGAGGDPGLQRADVDDDR